MIHKHDGILMAEEVIGKLNDLLRDAGLEEHIMVAEAFDNCREQGLCFSIPGGQTVAICNHRVCMDSVVVYIYEKTEFPTNLPADGHWNTMPVCNNDVEHAANAIMARIKEATQT